MLCHYHGSRSLRRAPRRARKRCWECGPASPPRAAPGTIVGTRLRACGVSMECLFSMLVGMISMAPDDSRAPGYEPAAGTGTLSFRS
jgi:hypothetical protein